MRKTRSKPNATLIIGKIIFLCAVLISITIFAVAQTRIILAKSENMKLQSSIQEMEKSIETLSLENSNLENELVDKTALYQDKLKNVKIAYLTFDDGPSGNTKKILDTLDRYNVKATFFVNYKEGRDEDYKDISKRGHVLANHTYSHIYSKVYSSKENFINDVTKLDDKLKSITGKEPSKILRFPGGSNNTISHNYGGSPKFMYELAKELKGMGYTFYDWNIDSTDASTFRQEKQIIVNRVLQDCQFVKHANILMHDLDHKDTTAEALPEIIEGLKAQGYVFDVLTHESPSTQFINIE